jgi:hypothetical protein
VGEADVTDAVVRVLAVLRDAGRAEGTVRRQQAVLDRFAGFLTGRGVDTWTVSSLVDRQLILPGSADRRNGYGIDTTSVHR